MKRSKRRVQKEEDLKYMMNKWWLKVTKSEMTTEEIEDFRGDCEDLDLNSDEVFSYIRGDSDEY